MFLEILQNSQENTCARVFFAKETLAQVFSCENLENNFFWEHLRAAASEHVMAICDVKTESNGCCSETRFVLVWCMLFFINPVRPPRTFQVQGKTSTVRPVFPDYLSVFMTMVFLILYYIKVKVCWIILVYSFPINIKTNKI